MPFSRDIPRRFSFRFDPGYRQFARLFGVTPEDARVEVREDEFEARYGRWRLRTPISNVASAEATGRTPFSRPQGRRDSRSPTVA